MPYFYNAAIKSKELENKFRKRDEIPSSMKISFFQFLSCSIEKIFIKYKNNGKNIRNLILTILSSEPEELVSFARESEEACIIRLFQTDADTFKQAIGNVSLSQEQLEKYLEISGIFVFVHLITISYELNKYSIAANKSVLHKSKSKHKNEIMTTISEEKDTESLKI